MSLKFTQILFKKE